MVLLLNRVCLFVFCFLLEGCRQVCGKRLKHCFLFRVVIIWSGGKGEALLCHI